MGDIYFKGLEGTEKNINKAMEYIEKSAEMKNADAKNYYALILFHGLEGIERNTEKAIKLLEESISLDNSNAMDNLALIYEEGRENVPKDIVKAVSLYTKAAALGHSDSIKSLANIYLKGKDSVEKDIDLSAFYFFLLFENNEDESSLKCFKNIAHSQKIQWFQKYHVYWNSPSDLDKQIEIILLISKFKKQSNNQLIPKLFVKGIAMKIVEYLCHLRQILNEENEN